MKDRHTFSEGKTERARDRRWCKSARDWNERERVKERESWKVKGKRVTSRDTHR